MPVFVFLAAALVQAAPVSPPQRDPDGTVIVTAKRIEDTERDLKACLARGCSPKEDMAASIAHAENQFIAGDYSGARVTLSASRVRNARFAKTLPVEVANITSAHGRMSSLEGSPQRGRLRQIEALEVLKAGLAPDDPRVLTQRLAQAGEYEKLLRLDEAERVYDDVERRARNAGHKLVQGHAMLRAAVLDGARASVQAEYRSSARKRIEAIERLDNPVFEPFKSAARMLRAQLTGKSDDPKVIDRAVAELRGAKVTRPVLLYAPPLEIPRDVEMRSGLVQLAGRDQTEWVDVTYWIAPDGTVKDIERTRQSAHVSPGWAEYAIEALGKRRYAPLSIDPSAPGLLRVERFSFVYDLLGGPGSRIPGRGRGRLEAVDLTAEAAPAPNASP